MRIALIQMVSGADLPANLRAAREALTQAAGQGADLAVLPEYFCLFGQRDTDKLAIAEEPGHGPIQNAIAEAAQRLGLAVVAGTLPLRTADPARVSNTCLVYGADGDCLARYDKIHLFRFDNGREAYDESRVLLAGREPVTVDLRTRAGDRWRVGLSVCYDLRFPELYRRLAADGADLLLAPSAFTHTTGEAHWELLLRARAVENLAYLAAAAQGGAHANGRRTWGHSAVIDPWGHILACRDASGPGVVIADLSRDRLASCRRQLPALEPRVL